MDSMRGRFVKGITYVGHCIKSDPILTLLIIVAACVYLLVVFPSGSHYCFNGRCGDFYWGSHEHDGIWHLALIESAFRVLPFQSPVFGGQSLGGYNFLLDLALYVLRLTGLSSSFLYFKVQSTIWFVVFCMLLYRYARVLGLTRPLVRWVFFITFFSTSFGIVIQLVRHNTIWGSVGNPSMQGALGMTNPQYMWSLCVLLALLILLQGKRRLWVTGVLVWIGLGLKFYFIVPALITVLWYAISSVIRRDYRKSMVIAVSCLIGCIAAYIMFYGNVSSGGLTFKPLEITHQIVEDPTMWFDKRMVEERYFIQQVGNYLSPRLIWIEIRTIFYFLFFNFGIRLLGVVGALYVLLKSPTLRSHVALLLIIITTTTVMPILFIQKGTWWNTIQFLYYAIFGSSILTAIVLGLASRRLGRIGTWVVVAVCIILFLPTQVETLGLFTRGEGTRYVPTGEIEALRVLARMPRGVVLTQPFTPGSTSILADTYDTAYVSAYSGHPTYLADEAQLTLLGKAYEDTQAKMARDPCGLLNEVDYVYIRRSSGERKLAECITEQDDWALKYHNNTSQIWARKHE